MPSNSFHTRSPRQWIPAIVATISLAGAAVVSSPGIADAVAGISLGDLTIVEGDTGTRDVLVTFSSADPLPAQCQVNFSSSGGTAVGGGDYNPIDGEIILDAGSVGVQRVVATIKGDVLFEPDETFDVRVFNAAGAIPPCPTIDRTAVITIQNDDIANPPTVSVANASIVEGDSGEVVMTAEFSATGPLAFECDVNFTDVGGSATRDVDWRSSPSGATFAAGSLASPVTIGVITVIGDTRFEGTESVAFRLFNDTDGIPNCPIVLGEGATLIINDDDQPTIRRISLSDASVTEGDSGTTNMTFTATLDGSADGTESFSATTTGGSGTDGSDFVGTNVFRSFSAGATSVQFTIPITGDTTDEPDDDAVFDTLWCAESFTWSRLVALTSTVASNL